MTEPKQLELPFEWDWHRQYNGYSPLHMPCPTCNTYTWHLPYSNGFAVIYLCDLCQTNQSVKEGK